MTTPPRDDQRNCNDILSDLQHTAWALQGLSEVMNPAAHLDLQPRANVATLISLLTERFDTLLDEMEQQWRTTPAATQEPEETQP
jgi:hypothetical protein